MRRLQFIACRNPVASSKLLGSSSSSIASLPSHRATRACSSYNKYSRFLPSSSHFSTVTSSMSATRPPFQLPSTPWNESPSFTQLVVDSMRQLYPEELADRAWDNVGLLLDNTTVAQMPIVMVTNDLTYKVGMDAIEKDVSVIVSYHPFIFSGLKSITNQDPQQATLIKLAQAGIAVYCPHTAVDAAPNGLNSWLADVVAGFHMTERSFAKMCQTAPDTHSPAGYGTIGEFQQPVSLNEILKRVAKELGGMKHLMVAVPVGESVTNITVRSFGVCAGSGYDVLKNADVDLIVTGEVSHHSALRAIQQGRTVVQVFHSNSERTYLQNDLRPRLEDMLRLSEPAAKVIVSDLDADPFQIVTVNELE